VKWHWPRCDLKSTGDCRLQQTVGAGDEADADEACAIEAIRAAGLFPEPENAAAAGDKK